MITSIEIQNFKGFGELKIPFGAITLLSGMNGSGKSTVIQSLLLLRQSYEQRFLPDRGLLLNGPLVEIGTAKDALYDAAETETIRFGVRLRSGMEASWSFVFDPSADVMGIAYGDNDRDIYDSELFLESFQYLSAERIGPRAAFTMADYVVNRQRQLGTRGEYTAHFLATYGKTRIAIPALMHPDASSPELLHQTEAWLRSVSPGVRLYVTPFQGIDTVQLEYSFITGDDESNRYRPTNVGFGLTYTLPVVVAILAAKPGSLLVFENPEAHLHGKGQRVLAELAALAAESGVQVILETHSDHVLNGIRVAVHSGRVRRETVMVHFFERRRADSGAGHAVVTPTIDDDGRIRGAPSGFFDEWDRSLDELIAPKKP
jgi:predicted ATPase